MRSSQISFSTIQTNLIQVFSQVYYRTAFTLLIISLFVFFYTQTKNELIIANYGYLYFYFVWLLQSFLIILLPLFIVLSAYKIFYFSSTSLKEEGAGGFAAFIGVLAAGCPACSITFLTYLGFAGFVGLFPYDGLELKVLSVILLIGINISILNTLQVCKLKKHHGR
jgi:hypothetical protein